jgi:hypothetical protein
MTIMIEKLQIAGLLLLLCVAIPLHAQAPKSPSPFEAVREFSATMNGALVGPPSDGKIYRSGDLMRVDLPTEYMVTDLATNATFAVIYSSGFCLGGSVPAGRTFPFIAAKNAKVTQSDRGEETIDKHPSKIEEVTISPEGRSDIKLTVWEAKDLQGFPVKMRRAATSLVVGSKDREVRYTDVQLGPPDPSLFVKPKDCGEAPKAPGSPKPTPTPALAAPPVPSKSGPPPN